MYCPIFKRPWLASMRFGGTSKESAESWHSRWSTGRSSNVLYAVQVSPGATAQTWLELLAHIAKSFGISSPSDNARTSTSRKEKAGRLFAEPPFEDAGPPGR